MIYPGNREFRRLSAGLAASLTLTEVDESSLFCILKKIEDISKCL